MSDPIALQEGENRVPLSLYGIADKFEMMLKREIKYDAFMGKWNTTRRPPDDHRDIVALIKKPVYVEAKKRLELMEVFEVIHREANGAFFLNGKPLPPKNVLKWTEIPQGWKE